MTQHLQTSRDLRRVNQRHLLKLIYFHGPISRSELSDRSGLSPATAANLASNMLQEGMITSIGLEESQGGRPREKLAINPEYGYIIGVEVAETHVYTELFDFKLNRLHDVRIEISPDENRANTIVQYIVDGIEQVQSQTQVVNADILGAGIGLPGIVNPVGGVSVFAPNWGWHDVPMMDMLREKLDINFILDNGKQALALAETWFGAGRECDDLAVLLIGTGIGAGLITQGRLIRGLTNSAGEWGHTCIDLNGPACRCGSRGCVEAFVGAPGIIRHLEEIAPESEWLKLNDQKLIVRALCDAALASNPVAEQVLQDVTRFLAAGIANLINIVNPQRIVIGGWCGELLNPFVLPRLKAAVEVFALPEPCSVIEFRATELEGIGIGMGAACLVLETFLTGELASPANYLVSE